MTEDDKDWRWEALCANQPDDAPEIDFFSEDRREIKAAKTMCKACPVRRECLSNALQLGEYHGVWGGVDERELQNALSINSQGLATIRTILPKCPLCGNKVLDSIEKRRTRTHVRCTRPECRFDWWTRRSMPKRVEKTV